MATTRRAAVAGSFYPSDPDTLRRDVDNLLAGAKGATHRRGPAPKVLIAPHAGYMYSGPVAAAAYAAIAEDNKKINRVVLLGPSHRVAFRGIAMTSASGYSTPLGTIRIDQESVAPLLAQKRLGVLDQAHSQEHSLEVHLPFLQCLLGDFQLVPLVVGDASKEDVATVIDSLWGGPETLIIISTDLSHYHPYEEARRRDGATTAKILRLEATLGGEEACGCRPLNGLLHLAQSKGLRIEQLALNNSGDTSGDKTRVVGYGAFLITEERTMGLSLAHRQQLLQIAREAIRGPLLNHPDYQLVTSTLPAQLLAQRAAFVTLQIDGRLRGCIGSLVAHRQLAVDVAANAQAAAFKDPRFKPLALPEFTETEIHISVLSQPELLPPMQRDAVLAILRPGIDGLIIEEHGKRSTYLPSVWEQLPTPAEFLRELRRKAGLAADGWSDETRVHRYTTEEFC